MYVARVYGAFADHRQSTWTIHCGCPYKVYDPMDLPGGWPMIYLSSDAGVWWGGSLRYGDERCDDGRVVDKSL